MDFSIRRRTEDDVALLVAVLERVHRAEGYPLIMPADPLGWITGQRTTEAWVADRAGERAVAHVALATAEGDHAEALWVEASGNRSDEIAVVKRLFVDPAAQRHGIGRALLHAGISAAHSRGLRPVLDVDSANKVAAGMYERAGFSWVGAIEMPWLTTERRFVADCYLGPSPVATSR